MGLNKSIEEIQKEPDVEWNSGAEYGAGGSAAFHTNLSEKMMCFLFHSLR